MIETAMTINSEIEVRTLNINDLEILQRFFINAYGELTAFRNKQFLLYYFDSKCKDLAPFSSNLIGINQEGEVVSHYGGLNYDLKIKNEIHSLTWGVSAYTLPEWRGKGINTKIVDYINENNEINGVIGFSRKAASFYQKLGYNIFNFERFIRYIHVLDYKKTLEAICLIKQDKERFKELVQTNNKKRPDSDLRKVVKITKKNIHQYELNLNEEFTEITTTHRTKEFLIWRFFKNPYISYILYGLIIENKILAYIALREEILQPLNYKVNRIIDLYGKKEGIFSLLEKSIRESISKNHIYIDFSMFGTIYKTELEICNFIKLENNDCCILPQVTSPIVNRPNDEFIGINSKYRENGIENLKKENVYFTRIDSDRDRINRIS